MEGQNHGDVFGLLTNVEVMSVIESNRKRSGNGAAPAHILQNREQVETQTLHYIRTNTPQSAHDMEAMKNCLSSIKKLDLQLTEAELLMIANLVPKSEVEIYLIIDQIAERGLEGHIQTILDVVASSFGLETQGGDDNE